ncbi:hypothetical protein Godav_028970 [Gossypium davidsonii]|uniref:GIR1-like zinc ribbon domain-containing protein n=1 Tax=Gossypium davidsonii TaxID=34287 RepID=A0A7J8TJF6_GOSDV|nr:hypothetical protein [Gossypium davidsonii]
MSRRNAPKLELKLNLSPPRARVNPGDVDAANVRYSSSPEETSMVLVGCPRCLMYVMLSEDDPKCPKCKSAVLLDFLHDTATTTTIKTRKG